jgi:hypothetical protein
MTAGNGTQATADIELLQQQVVLLAWLHTEQAMQVQRLAVALAGILAQMAQPQMQQNIINQLLGTQGG